MKLKRNFLLFIYALLIPFVGFAQTGIERPKLVVGIVVDQMRWDYLYRYYDRYSNNGFKRLLNEGYSFENCMVNYVPSFTAIGHTTIYTGSVPSIHGIAGNDFVEQATGRQIYCTEDSNVKSVGNNDPENKVGKHSPANMKVTTVCDQLRFATNFRSKVVGVAMKDRGSILPAGHMANAAYWFDGKTGNWITSTFYMDKLPKWLEDYNNLNMPEKYLAKDWNPTYPIDSYINSPSIDLLGRYEVPFKGYDKLTFPMKTSEMMKTLGAANLVQSTPYGDNLTIDVAKLAIENEKLGHNEYGETDFLTISFSSPDKMAHVFSINSILTEDAYIKLDQNLGEFFSYLDAKVGKDNYLVFLSADHAGTPNGIYANDHRAPGGLWAFGPREKELNNYLKTIYGRDDLVRNMMNYKVNFNYQAISEAKIDIEELKKHSIACLEKMEEVLYAIDIKKIGNAPIPSLIKEKITNGYNRERSGEIEIVLKSGWYDYFSTKGSTHGTWNPDDAHIPFVMMGWKVQPGRSTKEVYMTDIAATIAAMLRIQMPNGCIGKPVYNKF